MCDAAGRASLAPTRNASARQHKSVSLENELQEVISPRYLFGSWDVVTDGSFVKMGHIEIHSNDLGSYLGSSKRVVVLAATLGTGVDAFLQRLMHTDMAKAVLADKLASKLIEEYVNGVQVEIGIQGKRYSPGYGDFDIKHQKDILKMLGCEKIGLYLTDGYMLLPSKSITAILKLEVIND